MEKIVQVNQASATLNTFPEMKRKFDVGQSQNFEKQHVFKKTSKCKSKPNLVLRPPTNAGKQNLPKSVDSNTETSSSESISGPEVVTYPPPYKWRFNCFSSCRSIRNGHDTICVRLGYCFTPHQRLWLYNGAPFSRLLRHAGDTEDVFST